MTATSSSTIDRKINVLDENFDFYEIDLDADKILAYDILTCICRNTAGTWHFVEDERHVKRNIASLYATNDFLAVGYTKTYTKVVSNMVVPDETYTQHGISCGASVGLSSVSILFSTHGFSGSVSGAAGSLSATSNAFGGIESVAVDDNSVVSVSHTPMLGSLVAMQSNVEGVFPVVTEYASNYFRFKVVDKDGLLVTDIKKIDCSFICTGERKLVPLELSLPGSNIWVQGVMMKEFTD